MRVTRSVAACVLAGGLSSRLGREKARVRLGRRTMLGRVKLAAAQAGLPVAVLRRDVVPRCGPIGGIYTGLATTRAEAVLFLACDMPFVSAELVSRVLRRFERERRAVFIEHAGRRGFPCLIPRACLPKLELQIKRGQWSLQELSRVLRAAVVGIGPRGAGELFNINTPEDLEAARRHHRQRSRAFLRSAAVF